MNAVTTGKGASSGGEETLESAFRRDGFTVMRGVFDAAAIARLRAETERICEGAIGDVIGAREVSETGDGGRALENVLAIHFPHKISPVMEEFLHAPSIVSALTAVIGPDVKAMQSMLFVKGPGKPGQAWHQDEAFIPTEDGSLVGVWIAIDDATIENGALWMMPGSHAARHLWPLDTIADPRFDGSPEAVDFPYEREGGVPIIAKAGDVVLFDGFILHRSLNNVTHSEYRRALVNHVMNAGAKLFWTPNGETETARDYRDVVVLAGQDANAAAGFHDLSIPYIRPEDASGRAIVENKIAALQQARARS